MSDEDLIVAGLQPPYDTKFEVIVTRLQSSSEDSSVGHIPGFGSTVCAGTRKLQPPKEGQSAVEAVIEQMREEIQSDMSLLIKQNERLKKQYNKYGIGIFKLLDDQKWLGIRYAKITSENPNWQPS